MRFTGHTSNRLGFTLLEVVSVIGVMAILAVLLLPNLNSKKGNVELDSNTSKIVVLLREAQSRALAQSSSSIWGVHFENSTSTNVGAFFSLYSVSYNASSTLTKTPLSQGVRYVTSSLPLGGSLNVSFSPITGLPSASSSIQIELTNPVGFPSRPSSTISVNTFGAISF